MRDGQSRLFIALDLSDEARLEVSGLISAIDRLGIGGVRTVRSAGIHLTLRFVGDVERERIQTLVDAMRSASARTEPFTLVLGEVGAFPNVRNASVLWVGIDGDIDSVVQLRRRIEDEMSGHGFRRDRRRFNPHVTLARIRPGVSAEDRARLIDEIKSAGHTRTRFVINSVALYQSTLHPEGAIYHLLCRVQIGSHGDR